MRLAAMTLLCIALASPSFGQAQCGPRDAVIGTLATRYDETRRASGLSPAGAVEVWASDAGSWTITLTMPDGMTCLMSSGQGYEADPGDV